MDVFDRLLELAREGFFCAQIMLELALELEGKQDPDLIRAMGGLNEGAGGAGECGALTGGACCIAYFTGKGEADEVEHPQSQQMIRELREWFCGFTAEYGGASCERILAGDPANRVQRCPVVVRETFTKVMEILEAHGAI